MWRIALLSFLIAGSISAQFYYQNGLSPALVEYLQLTAAQQTEIVRANRSLADFKARKEQRSHDVEVEIDAETARPDLDPMALGLRYRELEAIRREIKAEQERTLNNLQALLTADQKRRVAALEDILRTVPTACEAVALNVASNPTGSTGSCGFSAIIIGFPTVTPVR